MGELECRSRRRGQEGVHREWLREVRPCKRELIPSLKEKGIARFDIVQVIALPCSHRIGPE